VTNDWGFDLLQFKPKSKRARQAPLSRTLDLLAMQEGDASATATSSRNDAKSPPLTPTHPLVSPHPHPAGVHTYPYGLRPHILYPLPIYPLAIFINLVLRLTWSIKLSSHLHAKAQGEGSFFIFWVEIAELVRRWVWVFIRVEWEIVRRAQDSAKRVEVSRESRVDGHSESFELVHTSVSEPLLKDRATTR
jgi:hypothetical protein